MNGIKLNFSFSRWSEKKSWFDGMLSSFSLLLFLWSGKHNSTLSSLQSKKLIEWREEGWVCFLLFYLRVMSCRSSAAKEFHFIWFHQIPFHLCCPFCYSWREEENEFVFVLIREIKVDGIEWMMWVEWAPKHITNNPVIWRVKLFNGGGSPQFTSFTNSIQQKRKENISFLFHSIDSLVNWWLME